LPDNLVLADQKFHYVAILDHFLNGQYF